MKYLEWHRGPTHGPLGVVGLGVVTRRARVDRTALLRPALAAERRERTDSTSAAGPDARRVVRHAGRGLDRRRAAARADGSADVVRHAAAEPVRLALVRRRLDADRRHLSADGAGHRPARPADAGAAARQGGVRAAADGDQLRRARAPRIIRRSSSRRGCSARRCRRRAIRRPRRRRSSTRGRGRRAPSSPPPGKRCLVEIVGDAVVRVAVHAGGSSRRCRTRTRSTTSTCSTSAIASRERIRRAVAADAALSERVDADGRRRRRRRTRTGVPRLLAVPGGAIRGRLATASTTVRWTDMRFAGGALALDQPAPRANAVHRHGPHRRRRPGPRDEIGSDASAD